MRARLIAACVKRLRDFGYPNCNAGNVLTDVVYSQFAEKMLQGTIEESGKASAIREACSALIAEIERYMKERSR